MLYLIWPRINDRVNNREAGDLRPYHALYGGIVMDIPSNMSRDNLSNGGGGGGGGKSVHLKA